MRKFKKIKVETYSGYKYDERPESFVWENKKFKVKRILENYYEKDGVESKLFNVFIIETLEGYIFNLYYQTNEDKWFLKVG